MNLVLCGFMGSGKTSLLRKLERGGSYLMERVSFFDMDDLILKNDPEFETLDQLIDNLGLESFREMEHSLLRNILDIGDQESHQVVALGGGTLSREARKLIFNVPETTLFWLDISFRQCVRNIRQDRAVVRPLARRGDHYLHELYRERGEIYSMSDIRLKPEMIERVNSVDELIMLIN
ncbi:MAG: hypothetical protein HN353_05305 [Bdellovibrionales bacterium]|nr:hypothetical protein [Bdellovibrionales bacterium]MBT3526464.1 hypothetical protein [Bdellovibrionales bacterium]MBT7669361.1 hypothetical protein [Bdellovibrionales bacterium]MBT7767620.1 hypothetical protein [Bdellovibrionales bacterium]